MLGAFVHAFINDLYNIPVDEVLKVEIEKLLHGCDTLITKRLERTSLVARIGSILGLMGILIPISPVLVTSYHLPELITPDQDVTIVKNPGEPTMEVIVKSGETIETLNMSETAIEEDVIGTVGTIYEMKGGGMIYVPSK
jgi:hypothetical protein